MPTSYTYPVWDGDMTEFADFAMYCARAFGYLYSLRDDSRTPIPEEILPSDYCKRRAEECRRELEQLRALTPEELAAKIESDHEQAVKDYDAYELDQEASDRRIRDMLEKVKAWVPPTPEHEGLKIFMIEQLDMSKREEYRSPRPKKVQDPQKWLRNKIAYLEKEIKGYSDNYAAEVKRAREATEWLKSLRASLGITK